MIEAAETAQRFVAGHQRGDLDTNEMLLFALEDGQRGIAGTSSVATTACAGPFLPMSQSQGH
jgi:hypothetical protein